MSLTLSGTNHCKIYDDMFLARLNSLICALYLDIWAKVTGLVICVRPSWVHLVECLHLSTLIMWLMAIVRTVSFAVSVWKKAVVRLLIVQETLAPCVGTVRG